jgi:hypothetical protein
MFEDKRRFKIYFRVCGSSNLSRSVHSLRPRIECHPSVLKPKDPNTVPNPHRFGPPTGNLRWHRWKEEEAPHLHTGDNKSKASVTTLSNTYPR